MRIAMLCSNHSVTDERITFKQAASLARMGHEIVVFGYKSELTLEIPNVTLETIAPFRIGIRARFSMIPKLYRAAAAWKPDIFTCHEPETARVGLELRKRYGGKVIFDVHELWHETMADRFPRFFRPLLKSIFTILLKRIGGLSDWVTVVSPASYDFYQAARADGRVEMIHNSPPLELFPPSNHSLQGPITVLQEGNLALRNGLLQILEAVARVRLTHDIRFVIAGRIRPEAQNTFDQRVAELGLGKIVAVSGWKPYEELGKFESQAQIGLICHQYTPNNFLSLGNKLYNYMASGKAIIGPVGSATADMIEKYHVGLSVDTHKPKEIADAIINLVDNVQLRKQFGDNGRKAIDMELGWHKMEKRLQNIYSQLGKELLS